MTNNINNMNNESTHKEEDQSSQLYSIIDKALNNDKKTLLNLIEKPSIKGLKYILQLDDETYEKNYMVVNKFTKKATSLNALKLWAQKHLDNEVDGTITIPVTYKPKDRMPKGRLYATGGINIQYLSKHLRGILLGKDYKDIDIANCWFSIALLICKHYEAQGGIIEYSYLNYYVNNRDAVFKKMKFPKAEGKELISSIWNTDKYLCQINDEFLLAFYYEKVKIIDTIINDSKYISKYDELDIIHNSPDPEKLNPMSSKMWYLISIIETSIVLDKIQDCKEATYLYDGAMISKDTPFEPSSLHGITWIEKPIPMCKIYISWKPKDKYLEKVYNAVHGSMHVKSATFSLVADWLLSIVGNRFAYCDKSQYKCNKSNVWEIVDNGDGDIQQLLGKHILPHIKQEQSIQQQKCIDDIENIKAHRAIVKKWNVIIDYLSGDAGWLAFKNILVGKSKMNNNKFPDKLDLLKEYICFSNKKYNLKTKEWSYIIPEDYISITTGYDYEEPTVDETSMLNEMYLNKIFVDKGDREHFMKSMCAVLDGNCRRRKMNIFTNSGSNGKSVICDLLKHTLGKYHSSAKSTIIQRPKSSSGSADPELFRFKNCRMVQMNEPDKGEKMNSSFIKELTGGDHLSGRQLHSNQIVEFKPTASLCLLANDIPALDCTDIATLGRMNVIPFNSTFRSDITEDDWKNKEFVADNKVLENYDNVKNAFFNDIVTYYSIYLSNTDWSYTSELSNEYMDSQDFVKQLMDTYTEKALSAERINVKDLYDLMKVDMALKEHCPSSTRKFYDILRKKGYKILKSNSLYQIRGFRLKSTENEIELIIDELDS